ncbi:MAG: hypothetical protein A3B68_04365 [Candidatus Melainabacteria bacterium RIFCSPHIGHO2_02_FULL_34_12]|nr:MAG: hypothetical protein A3B68_04365 [Candidatus Melainabacteria bacterium RIFCSPHIGHO2_02_FULL_34_12]
MQFKDKKLNKSERIGQLIFIESLVFYFLIKLPFNLSVLCSDTNEGFYFIFGQHFLNGTHFDVSEMIYTNLFVLIYALIIKLFGFGTWSIIAVHITQTVIVLLIAALIFSITCKLFENTFYASLSVLFWILMQVTPIGQWGNKMELESAFALNPEYFIVLFSLCSVFCLLGSLYGKKSLLMAFSAGFIGASSVMLKASGAVMPLAIICWIVYLGLFNRKLFITYKNTFLILLIGLIFSFAVFNFWIFLQNNNLMAFWKYYFEVGAYSDDYAKSYSSFFLSICNFMTRYTTSMNNFILFFFAFFSLGWGLVRNIFIKSSSDLFKLACPLLAIWGWGNICSVIAVGGYGSYYYILVWPSVAIFFMIGLRDIYNYGTFINRNFLVVGTLILIASLFICRILVIFPAYIQIAKSNFYLNSIFQPQSFQDPVIVSGKVNYRRPDILKLADLINSFLPDKNDTIYILSFKNKTQYLPLTMYVYIKRFPPTTSISEYFGYKKLLKIKLKALTRDLVKTPPKILIVPRIFYLEPWQTEDLTLFLNWLNLFVDKNYHAKIDIKYKEPGIDRVEIYDVYERN